MAMLQDLIIIELLLAQDVLSISQNPGSLGVATGKALLAVEDAIDRAPTDAASSDIHESVRVAMFERVEYRGSA